MVYIKFNAWNDKWDKNGMFPLSKKECEEIQEVIEHEEKEIKIRKKKESMEGK